METYGWRGNNSLTNWLYAEGFRFDFYQAVKILETMRPNSEPLGEGTEPEQEAVRFMSRVNMGFPATNIDEIYKPKHEDDLPIMVVNFMGLAGHFGPLPLPYTELVLDRIRHKDTSLRDFLDIFNHRLISLMYRARKKIRIGFEQQAPEKTNFAGYLFSLMGLGTKGLKNRLKVEDRAILRYAGLFAQKPHSISGLQAILMDHFKMNIRMQSFVGQWFKLDKNQLTEIGVIGQNQILGQSAVLGNRVWDQQSKFQIHIGPLTMARFREFLPIGTKFAEILSLTEFYAGHEFDYEIVLTLNAEDIPATRLSGDIGITRLGWNSWLRSQEPKHNTEVKLSPRTLAKLYLIVIWHNDIGIDMAMEKIPSTMLTSAQ
ncbi:MAG: type VI secretion system baseplate subunit TssG [Bacteroidetes bacterium]|nr:type VI secretion system baseplate subunit TssG [Bacteroidota bacterium]